MNTEQIEAEEQFNIVKLILRTAALTLAAILIAAPILAALIFSAAPAAAYKAYNKIGNVKGAYNYAQAAYYKAGKRYEKLSGSAASDYNINYRLEHLSAAINNGGIVFSKAARKNSKKHIRRYGAELIGYCMEYLFYSDGIDRAEHEALYNARELARVADKGSHLYVNNYYSYVDSIRIDAYYTIGEKQFAFDEAYDSFFTLVSRLGPRGTGEYPTLSEITVNQGYRISRAMNTYIECLLYDAGFEHTANILFSRTGNNYDPKNFYNVALFPDAPFAAVDFDKKLKDYLNLIDGITKVNEAPVQELLTALDLAYLAYALATKMYYVYAAYVIYRYDIYRNNPGTGNPGSLDYLYEDWGERMNKWKNRLYGDLEDGYKGLVEIYRRAA